MTRFISMASRQDCINSERQWCREIGSLTKSYCFQKVISKNFYLFSWKKGAHSELNYGCWYCKVSQCILVVAVTTSPQLSTEAGLYARFLNLRICKVKRARYAGRIFFTSSSNRNRFNDFRRTEMVYQSWYWKEWEEMNGLFQEIFKD